VFSLVRQGKAGRDAVPLMIREAARDPSRDVGAIAAKLGGGGLDSKALEKLVRKVVAGKKELLSHPNREKMLMGLVMREVRGRADGRAVMEALRRELKRAGGKP
jgi:Glu-tRNA(Gln) amidotransferase subunit E-like FAD-binding protein